MSTEPADRPLPSPAEAQPSSLRCPFCNTIGVEIRQVQERRLGTGGQPGADSERRLSGGTIYEFQVFCPRCKKKYRQTCPGNLLPEGFNPTA